MSFDFISKVVNLKNPVLSYETSPYDFEATKLLILDSVRKHSKIQLLEAEPSFCVIQKKENDIEYKRIRFRINEYSNIDCVLLYHFKEEEVPLIVICAGKNSDIEVINGLKQSEFNLNIAEQIAKKGFHTLTFDYGISTEFFEKRDNLDVYHVTSGLFGISPLSIILENILAVMEWVNKQPGYGKLQLQHKWSISFIWYSE